MSEIAYVGDTSGDESLDVTFYKNYQDGQEVDFVRIAILGDKTLTVDTKVEEQHKRRFARKWQAYQGLQTMTGTPTAEWGDIPETLRNEFIYQGFKYVEQIAGAPDAAFTRIMGGVQWRTKAQAFLNRGKVAESDMIKQQAEMIAKLQEQMAQLLGDAPAKKGRKAKEEVAENE